MSIQLNVFAFRSRFPEFKTVPSDTVTFMLEYAATQLSKDVWTIGNDYELGILYLTAHMVSKWQQTQANASDGSGATDLFVQSIHFGERSVSFGRRGDSDSKVGALGLGEKGLDDTLYGQMFLNLRQRNVPSIAIC